MVDTNIKSNLLSSGQEQVDLQVTKVEPASDEVDRTLPSWIFGYFSILFLLGGVLTRGVTILRNNGACPSDNEVNAVLPLTANNYGDDYDDYFDDGDDSGEYHISPFNISNKLSFLSVNVAFFLFTYFLSKLRPNDDADKVNRFRFSICFLILDLIYIAFKIIKSFHYCSETATGIRDIFPLFTYSLNILVLYKNVQYDYDFHLQTMILVSIVLMTEIIQEGMHSELPANLVFNYFNVKNAVVIFEAYAKDTWYHIGYKWIRGNSDTIRNGRLLFLFFCGCMLLQIFFNFHDKNCFISWFIFSLSQCLIIFCLIFMAWYGNRETTGNQ